MEDKEFWDSIKQDSFHTKTQKVMEQFNDRIFSEDMSEIYGEKIIGIGYHHPFMYSELADIAEGWDLKKKLVHLTDMVDYNPFRNKITCQDEGNYNNLTELEGNNIEGQSEWDLSQSLFLFQTEKHTYLIRRFPGANADDSLPYAFSTIDNEMHIRRTGNLTVHQLPKEAYNEFLSNGVSSLCDNYFGDEFEVQRLLVNPDRTKNEFDYLLNDVG